MSVVRRCDGCIRCWLECPTASRSPCHLVGSVPEQPRRTVVKVKVKERIVLREIHLRTTGRYLSMGSHSVICHPTEVTARGGAPIGAGGSWPPTFRGKGGRGGHNLGIIHISHCSYHAFTLTSTLCRLYPGVWYITPSTMFRLAACRQRNNSNITRPR